MANQAKTTKLEEDTRPLVSDLLKKHSEAVAEVRAALQDNPIYKANVDRYDDIWILRFVLSHKKVKPATVAALKTIQFREERKVNELGDIRHKSLVSCKQHEEGFDIINKYASYALQEDGIMHTFPCVDRGVVTYILPGHINMSQMTQEMTVDELLQCYLLGNEAIFQVMDEVTRRTGRLTKLLRVMDFVDMSLLGMDRAYIKMDAKASKILEDCYPQLLGTILITNAPGWLYGLWNALKFLFPKRMVEKLGFVAPLKNPKDLQRFQQYVSLEHLPERYGGKNKVWPLVCASEYFQNVKKNQAQI